MSIWTIEELDEQIAIYKDALAKAASGQYISIAGRMLTQQNLSEIRKTLKYYEAERNKLVRGYGPIAVQGRVAR